MVRYIVTLTFAVFIALVGVLAVGCETQAQTDSLIGAGAGAGIGAIVGHQKGKTAEGALIGGAVGGGAGYIVGNEADKKQQKQEMQNIQQEMNVVTVNIKNSNGSISTVRLTKSGVGYVGPRGEYYDHLPTEAELKPVYGF
jgi:uncharacterized protein YcfJ